jgi:hypothetical protein
MYTARESRVAGESSAEDRIMRTAGAGPCWREVRQRTALAELRRCLVERPKSKVCGNLLPLVMGT